MRVSQFFLSTLKEAPAEAELVSHRLMLRAGLIKRLGSGLYSWMPLGLRVLRKVEAIVREEMNKAGALELLMPAVTPAELWQETGRWEVFGPQMLKIKDRHERDFCFGPTHEEVITDIARKEIRSYKQLPLNFYQIQTKFRDEIRPRYGVMRAREFVMKDAYSFHVDKASLEQTYEVMYQAYSDIFNRLGLKFRAVRADTGAIGGTGSHEFHVLADSGEDAIAFCPDSDYAANVELAEALAPVAPRADATQTMEKVATPGKKSITEVSEFLQLGAERTVKAIAVMHDDAFYMLLLRGDHELNEVKAQKILDPFRFATPEEIQQYMGGKAGYIGPVGADVNIIADHAVLAMSDFVCGANEEGYHLTGVNFGRDLPIPPQVADIRNVVAGDPSPDGKGSLDICRGIEVGHIFQLGNKYSQAMEASYLDENGQHQVMEMGCYGIGVSRIVGAAIEQGFDERGIIFPASIAPFAVAIAAIGFDRSDAVRESALKLHDELQAAGIDVLLDDRGERPGVMFADLELIGIPHRITIGERGLKDGQVEYQARNGGEMRNVALGEVAGFLASIICGD
ncbi:MAG TPA: proline--tRNA ligase [Novimethylophilus sp.]|jgi:prolyl-tRNA synthetase|uniref:proline--tRNA ligase n=1 Tax=Novimethylophilus sp. TaxID=2137426 RepID=UPI002F42EA0E